MHVMIVTQSSIDVYILSNISLNHETFEKKKKKT